VPITPGKNITVIAEVIALNYLVKVTGGYSPAERLNQHLIELMKRKSAARTGCARTPSDGRVPALLVMHADLARRCCARRAGVRADRRRRRCSRTRAVARPTSSGRSRARGGWTAGGLVLTDFWGGSCHQCGVRAARGHGEVIIITGINLPRP
jgi:hypothetical protein